jgi:exosortase/archaeosortase family protein
MSRHVLGVLTRLTLTFAVTIGLFELLLDPWRNEEAKLIAGALGGLGSAGASQVFGNRILVIPDAATPFLATISPSCSSLAAILAFGAIALFLVRGEPGRRVLAFLAAATLVMVCNLLRIGLSIWVGLRTDANGLTLFHDWVGTAFGLLYVLGGFTVFLWVLLPSPHQLLKEYEAGRTQWTPPPSDEPTPAGPGPGPGTTETGVKA